MNQRPAGQRVEIRDQVLGVQREVAVRVVLEAVADHRDAGVRGRAAVERQSDAGDALGRILGQVKALQEAAVGVARVTQAQKLKRPGACGRSRTPRIPRRADLFHKTRPTQQQ